MAFVALGVAAFVVVAGVVVVGAGRTGLVVGVVVPLGVVLPLEVRASAGLEPAAAGFEAAATAEPAVWSTAVSRVRVVAVERRAVGVEPSVVVDASFTKRPTFLAHQLGFGSTRGSCLVLVVDLALFFQPGQDLLLVVVEKVFPEAVRFKQSDTTVLRAGFELQGTSKRP